MCFALGDIREGFGDGLVAAKMMKPEIPAKERALRARCTHIANGFQKWRKMLRDGEYDYL